MTEPFGAYPLTPLQQWIRALAHRLPANYFGRKAASLLLGPAGGRARRPLDVEIFGGQKARLHPFDNICEKRVFATPQLWDPRERALLGAAISARNSGTFAFVDVGANVGLYTLFARAEAARAGVRLVAVCVEADAEMTARLRFNLAASGATDGVMIFACAASDKEGEVSFAVDRNSRGLSRVDPTGGALVPARGLAAILAEAGLDHVDAMKIDIEGHEFAALDAFFRNAPAALHPRLIILETSHTDEEQRPEALLRRHGYRCTLQTVRNAAFVRDGQTPG